LEGASAGCSAATANPANVQILASILSIPPSYDGRTPVPLLFAFHGANRTNLNMRNDDSRTNGSVLEQNYVVAYMKSQGNAWDLGTDYPRFNMALGQALSQLCIETRAIFAMGHSSGAQFIAQMLGDNRARERRFAGVAPVSSSRFGNPAWSPVPTFLIHGLLDSNRQQDPNGAIDITQYTESNQCSGGTQPFNVPTCTTFAGNNATVNPGCVRYNGCAAVTQFCNHNDPNYLENGQPSNHGWPCFATQEIFDFFEELR
jgi:poly(3-hydroxybutyrate) depolymerase